MIKVPLSSIESPAAFAAALEAHRAAVEAHMMGKPDVPAPIVDELLAALVQRVPDVGPVEQRGPDRIVVGEYEVFDDTPPPPTLADRKQEFCMRLQQAAEAARNSVLSPARANLLAFDVADAVSVPEEMRTAAQVAAIELHTAYSSRCADISRVVARALVEIDELTDGDVASWLLPSFG